MIKKNNFETIAKNFIANEATFANNFLLQKNINYEQNEITLTYGGQKLEESDLEKLKKRSSIYGLDSVKIIVKQGFNFALPNSTDQAKLKSTDAPIVSNENFAKMISFQDSINMEQRLSAQVFKELRSQYKDISGFSISYVMVRTDSTNRKEKLILVETNKPLPKEEKDKLKNYLRLRVENDSAKVIISEK